jgi:hypothetical protein
MGVKFGYLTLNEERKLSFRTASGGQLALKWREAGKDYIMWSLIKCTLHQIISRLSNQGNMINSTKF